MTYKTIYELRTPNSVEGIAWNVDYYALEAYGDQYLPGNYYIKPLRISIK